MDAIGHARTTTTRRRAPDNRDGAGERLWQCGGGA